MSNYSPLPNNLSGDDPDAFVITGSKKRKTLKDRFMNQFKLNAILAEFIGTYILALTLGMVAINANTIEDVSISVLLVLSTSIEMFRDISGSHFNPAVTFGNFVRGTIGISNTILYITSQILGAIAGVATAYQFLLSTFNYNLKDMFVVVPPQVLPDVILGGEFLFSFMLVLVMLNVTSHKESEKRNSLVGISVASVVSAGIFSLGNITGACFNPAIASGAAIIHVLWNKAIDPEKMNWDPLKYVWYYWTAPMAAGFAAAIIYFVISPSEFKRLYKEWHPLKLLL